MSPKVSRECTLRHTLIVTSLKGAMKSCDLGMSTEVVEETSFLRKRPSTPRDGTNKWFCARVGPKVSRESTLLNTFVVTSLKGAMKSFNLGMTTEVGEEMTFL